MNQITMSPGLQKVHDEVMNKMENRHKINFDKLKYAERLLHLFANDGIHRRIFDLVLSRTELCVTEIHLSLRLDQSTVSNSLIRMRQLGWIKDRREGKYTFCRVNRFLLNKINKALKNYANDDLSR